MRHEFRALRNVIAIGVVACLLGGANAGERLRSPNGKIEVSVESKKGTVSYSVTLAGKAIVRPSPLGLRSGDSQALKVFGSSRSSESSRWTAVWGPQKSVENAYNQISLEVADAKAKGEARQTIEVRAYDDGVAFRYLLPAADGKGQTLRLQENSGVEIVSKKPILWYPLSSTLVSDAVDVNAWEPAKEGEGKRNHYKRYTFKPETLTTPVTVKLSDSAYVSLHEAGMNHESIRGVQLEGHAFSYRKTVGSGEGVVTPWRTITISDKPGGLIESSMVLNLNEPSSLRDTSWIKPGKTMWDWRNHGAHADDGFKYGLTTESYIRYIDFAAENNLQYVLVDAEWYGPERDPNSDPKVHLPQIDIPMLCAYAKSKGVAMWLYLNSVAMAKYDLDETFSLYQKWGVAGIKMGFLGAAGKRNPIAFSNEIVKKCADYQIQYALHEPYKPTGYHRTLPNILAYEFVNSMLDGPNRPSATPSRLINQLFVHALTGPVDRSCGMFDLDTFISREKCHRQLPTTVASQVAQCLLFPSGLLTLPDHPDAYRRKADLFEFIAKMPMTWDETRVLDAEIGKRITLARRSGEQWFVASLADEQGLETSVSLDFLEEGVRYDVTLYEDAPDAHNEYFGPGTKIEATETGQEMVPHETRRERYQVRKFTVKRGDVLPFVIAPGGGHSMWIRPEAR